MRDPRAAGLTAFGKQLLATLEAEPAFANLLSQLAQAGGARRWITTR